MKIYYILMAGAAALSNAVSAPANAANLNFMFTGPSGTASFQLESNPTPDFSSTFLGSEQFGFTPPPTSVSRSF